MQPVAGPIFRPTPNENRGGASLDGCPRRSRVPLRYVDRGSHRKGTLIRHAGLGRPLATAPPVFPLAVAMIKPPLRAPLVAAVGAAALFEPGLGAASRAAIALAAITVRTNPEHRVTFPAAVNPLTENHFAMQRHPRRQAGLDNSSQSWQVKTIESGDLPKVAKRDSAASDGGVPSPFPPSRRDVTPVASRADDDVRLRRR